VLLLVADVPGILWTDLRDRCICLGRAYSGNTILHTTDSRIHMILQYMAYWTSETSRTESDSKSDRTRNSLANPERTEDK
jgi:hypothetical protein